MEERLQSRWNHMRVYNLIDLINRLESGSKSMVHCAAREKFVVFHRDRLCAQGGQAGFSAICRSLTSALTGDKPDVDKPFVTWPPMRAWAMNE
jgi:hypothetical protein